MGIRMKKLFLSIVLAAGFSLATSNGTSAGGENKTITDPSEEKGVRCIKLRRIRHSKVIDNQTIILYMNGGPDYQMNLVRRCPGLKFQKTWYHDDGNSMATLCNVDTIEVPVNTVGNVLTASRVPCMIDTIVEYEDPKKQKKR